MLNNLSEPEIKAKFEYKGTEILRLWRVNILFENISNKTIVGSGQLKNIINNNLTFYISPDFQVIDNKLIKSDFNHKLQIVGLDTIQISFGQWRSGEQLRYALYIRTDSIKAPSLEIFNQPPDRQIIDGDIIFTNKEDVKKKQLLTDSLGIPIKMVSYVLGIITYSIIILFILIMFVSNIGGFILRKSWYKKYFSSYTDHIKKTSKQDFIQHYIDNPQEYTDWKKFNGKEYPTEWGLDFNIIKTISFVAVEFFLLIITFAQIVILLDIIQLFP
jgi:hypothetical protein